MELAWYVYLLAILAGMAAGAVNTLAGSGSLITLPVLVFLGLPANVANGTNRVGVIVQNIVGLATLRRGGALEMEGSSWYLVPVILGAIAGATIAAELDERAMNIAIGVVMLLMLGVVMFKPGRWLAETSTVEPGRPPWWLLLSFVAIGAYGGFIQAGVGILLLVGLVMGAGYNAVAANGIKLFLALVFTIAAMIVFAINDQIDWALGALMATGQASGAWLAARFAVKTEHAGRWIRRILILVVLASVGKFFGLYDWIL